MGSGGGFAARDVGEDIVATDGCVVATEASGVVFSGGVVALWRAASIAFGGGGGGGVALWRAASIAFGGGAGVALRRAAVGTGVAAVGASGVAVIGASGVASVGLRGRSSAVDDRRVLAGASELASIAALAVGARSGASSALEVAGCSNAVASRPIAAASAWSTSIGSLELDAFGAGGDAISTGHLRLLIRCAKGLAFVLDANIDTPGVRSFAPGAGIGTFIFAVGAGGEIFAIGICGATTSSRGMANAASEVDDVDTSGVCSTDSKTSASFTFECRELIVERSCDVGARRNVRQSSNSCQGEKRGSRRCKLRRVR